MAPRIEEPDGSLDFSLRRFPRLRSSFAQALFLHRVFPEASWVDEVIRDPAEYEHPHPVEWVSGACFGVRRSVLEQIGGIDESFFHYSEDVDLCARIWEAGYEVRYVPDALAMHEGGASAPRTRLLADPRRQPHPLLGQARLGARAPSPSARASRSGPQRTSSLARNAAAAGKGHLRALGVALQAASGRT